ncbi:polysaccharide biosynthesis protein [Stutzerimonas decontaminans]|uniref:Polysaccharide biosynthesis protein n=2 Tax=Stutzerimonas TaxID=2901164 RepID=A0ABX4VSR5_9GAMM|nr:oligosaccharide flippase family protein [Stutzerimonas decontaminans]AHY43382.1 polysaccharide biosynthesis protein [Stutzerimonas decontaminans]MCQ4246996.1 oligosaccharide flippase family protein [Stutzerimonas decontaminans]PNF82888.1 polysaccharide biosynthesis protein [Stutzerimonas decontaminans]
MSDPKRLSVIRNTSLNYLGQAYALLIGILILPFYLGHLGAEAYGLIGFFAVLQAWLQLLDAGMSPALVRQVAHYRGQGDLAEGHGPAGRLLRSFELLLLPIALITCVSIFFGSGWIAHTWLQARELSTTTITECISLMGLMVGMRLYATLYKSGLQGVELHGWLNAANMLIATLRYFGGLFLVAYISQDPLDFFLFQAAVALAEMLAFASKAYVQLSSPRLFTGIDWRVIRPVLPFAGGMFFTSLLWIVLTQLDKVLLSKVLLLKEYGYFSLVALITTGIMTLTNPLVQTLLPRMTMLVAEGRIGEMERLYLNASRFVCSVLFPMAAVIAWHGQSLIFAWTGDLAAAEWSERLLFWYVPGSALMAVGAFQFYLQYAYGQLRLHIWYSVISTAISVPIVAYAALVHGAYGAALAWFFLRLTTFVVWPPMVHRRFAPGLQAIWARDMLRISAMTALGLALGEPLFALIASDNRFDILLALAVSGAICLLLVAASSKPLVLKLYLLIKRAPKNGIEERASLD